MKIFKRTNKKFDYKPRFYKGEENPYKIEHKLDKFRTSVGKNKGLKANLKTAVNEFKNSKDSGFNKTIMIIIAILVFIFLYIIDFDLSIFSKK